jgi:glycosyltransferase involved in cell wall biosynthesis
MKILFISDFDLSHAGGGAQISNDIIIKKGIELGHDITLHNFDSSPLNLIYNYDLVISSNLECINNFYPNVIQFIINHPNHIRLEHDSCLYLNEQDRELLFNSSKINFFLSEFHLKFFKENYGDIFGNVEIVYDPVDTSLFFNDNSEKIYDIVYCGFLHELKGLNNLIDFCKKNTERKVDIFGWSQDLELDKNLSSLSNVKLHDKLSHFEIANVLRKAKYIYHSPQVNEPFCRMVGEALLCGCEFIGDESKIGSLQEFRKHGEKEFSQRCHNAANIFWQTIEKNYEQSI